MEYDSPLGLGGYDYKTRLFSNYRVIYTKFNFAKVS
jgi:hypothetical protein